MPSIKKAEYERLKHLEVLYTELVDFHNGIVDGFNHQIEELNGLVAMWKRYYEASRETFRIEDTLEIPSCFKPQDSIEYIISKQEASDGPDHNA